MKTSQEQQNAMTSSPKQPPSTRQIRNSKPHFAVIFPLVMILPLILVSCESDEVAKSKPEGKYEKIGKDIDRVVALKEKIDNLCGK